MEKINDEIMLFLKNIAETTPNSFQHVSNTFTLFYCQSGELTEAMQKTKKYFNR